MQFVSQAIVAVLQHEAETANRYLEVVEFTTTQNEIVNILEEESGAKLALSHRSTADSDREGHAKMASGSGGLFDILQLFSFQDGAGHAVREEDTANKLLGLPESDLRAALREYVRTRGA